MVLEAIDQELGEPIVPGWLEVDPVVHEVLVTNDGFRKRLEAASQVAERRVEFARYVANDFHITLVQRYELRQVFQPALTEVAGFVAWRVICGDLMVR